MKSIPRGAQGVIFLKFHSYYTILKIVHFPSGSAVKNPPAIQETWAQSLGQEDHLEKEMATNSSILAWRIPRTEEPGGVWSFGLQKSWTRLSEQQKKTADSTYCSTHGLKTSSFGMGIWKVKAGATTKTCWSSGCISRRPQVIFSYNFKFEKYWFRARSCLFTKLSILGYAQEYWNSLELFVVVMPDSLWPHGL